MQIRNLLNQIKPLAVLAGVFSPVAYVLYQHKSEHQPQSKIIETDILQLLRATYGTTPENQTTSKHYGARGYYGVEKVKKIGTKINSSRYKGMSAEDAQNATIHTIAILNNVLYSVAPDVTLSSEFKSHSDAYSQGNWLTMDLYEVSTIFLGVCSDEGRVSDDLQ